MCSLPGVTGVTPGVCSCLLLLKRHTRCVSFERFVHTILLDEAINLGFYAKVCVAFKGVHTAHAKRMYSIIDSLCIRFKFGLVSDTVGLGTKLFGWLQNNFIYTTGLIKIHSWFAQYTVAALSKNIR